jgi:hypothetical protein
VYHNPEGRTIPEGGMGVMGGVLMLPRGGRWPSIDRSHPDYVSDARTLFAPADSAAAHHHHGGPRR